MDRIAAAVTAFPEVPPGLSYGTAGFRSVYSNLPGIMFRMGLLATIRARNQGKSVGVMVTASHNPVKDNGVKMIDVDGGMLSQSWEKYAGLLAKVSNANLVEELRRIATDVNVSLDSVESTGLSVAIACDTRPHSKELLSYVRAGIEACGLTAVDYGVLTTPQLHHIVRINNYPPRFPSSLVGSLSQDEIKKRYGNVDGYFRLILDGFEGIMKSSPNKTGSELIYDCAHGVGAIHAKRFAELLKPYFPIHLRNTGATPEEIEVMNDGVGAEHCQKDRLPPKNFNAETDLNKRLASLDGDADRLVYHYFRESSDGKKEWRLLDGDKIACLLSSFIGDLIKRAGLQIVNSPTHLHSSDSHSGSVFIDEYAPSGKPASEFLSRPISMGVVQTAYANGASTNYVRNDLMLPSLLAKTGVKYVHHAAVEFDIGVYFEANGHGTAIFHPSFRRELVEFLSLPADELNKLVSPEQLQALQNVFWASILINQAIGDALSDSIAVEAVLMMRQWSVAQWDAIYEDLPSRQSKLAVPDRTAFVPVADETRLIQPASLQAQFDQLVVGVKNGRAFARPSGTEDVVRIYAEAQTQQLADQLAKDVEAAIRSAV